MWIHQHSDWPHFSWDEVALNSQLAGVEYQRGRLLGHMEVVGFDLRQEACLRIFAQDVVKSSAIEGEDLNVLEVRSSIARRLGLDEGGLMGSGSSVEGIVEMILDATQKCYEPLTEERLFHWHRALFSSGSTLPAKVVGRWRSSEGGPMQIVSGAMGREKVHYIAPEADRVDEEMEKFLSWFNTEQPEVNLLIKAGIAHLWFENIHPFEDGNGRIGRAICDMVLARSDGTDQRFYSLSSQFAKERKDYYFHLEEQGRSSPEITLWLKWFLGCVERAFLNSKNILDHTLFKAKVWRMLQGHPINDRQRLIINRMLGDDFKGYMNTSKYMKMTKCSRDVALRDLKELKELRVLFQNSPKARQRQLSYRIVRKEDL